MTSTSSDLSAGPVDLDYILSTRAVRDRSGKIFDLCQNGKTNFKLDLSKLNEIADYVAEITRANYPKLDIPFHSRWKHFQVGGIDRKAKIQSALAALSPLERAVSKIDLVVCSVLLDAGAGDDWKYKEAETGNVSNRSEGLAVASLHFFTSGKLSSNSANKFQADAKALQALDFKDFCAAFQVSDANPLAGCEGRFTLLKKLGAVVAANTAVFSSGSAAANNGGWAATANSDNARIGNLAHYLLKKFPSKNIRALDVLRALQDGLGAIWPGRVSLNGYNVGDVWIYPPLGEGLDSLVPFHKLSLWLSYSLVEPLTEAGFSISGFEELSGLPEYRNGGLFVDMGALNLRDAALAARAHAPSSELIVEWRALTICLLDRLAPLVRERLKKTETELPLGKVLEGGTWAAGRKIAALKRKGGGSPLLLESDGTVF